MRALFVTNMYPTEKNPAFGIFVKEQVQDIARAIDLEYDIHFINARENGKLAYLKSMWELPAKIRKGKYDIIHIHYGFSGLFLLSYRPKAKVFLTLHGADILKKQGKHLQVFFTKKILKRVHKVYTLNPEMESIVRPLNSNYETLPCGVNIDFFKPATDKKQKSNEKLIIFPGAPAVPVKDFPLFQEVIEHLKATSEYEINYACIQNLSRAGVRDLLNEGDCLLMTSISEGSPQVIKEALSCGLPVVSVPVGDVSAMVKGVPYCKVSSSRSAKELSKLVLEGLDGDKMAIRKAFIEKGVYDHLSVTRRLKEAYQSSTFQLALKTTH